MNAALITADGVLAASMFWRLLRQAMARNPGVPVVRLLREPFQKTATFLTTVVLAPYLVWHLMPLAPLYGFYLSATVVLAGPIVIVGWYAWIEVASAKRRSLR